ncbi:enoyl-CoA hydratase/isomerase family protein [Nocardioides sp. zg-536]|uniref:Enoyl-CoA hydratase/isomerase family protein n=1 Tax=Nocardioides faecalis TaxID=2803858 RepID=A0A938Y7V4_9ACTN|nr:enoyl-CoA hydratase-related protein [Nocardioides faecalis]MBM9460829.1 enoyl-CoA hydratase/isomerase family protein [Nocardioides faecalis]QVI58017.1 enoyl-CoA hydratase/isomerase family protein [Nocardioides faecalis]
MTSFVLSRVEDGIGFLTLNDPDRLNPVTFERIAQINTAAREMSARDDVRVVVVTGAGRSFCAGADLAGEDTFLTDDSPPASGSVVAAPGLWTLTAMPQPVIAMINGPAVGYGLELALQADIRVAGASARIGHPAAKLGAITDTGAATWLLPRLVGPGVAAEILFSGQLYDAEAALRMRLVNHVVPDAELSAFTTELAATIAANSPWAVRTTKRLLFNALEDTSRGAVLEQYLHVNDGDPDYDPSVHLARFRRR